MIFHWLFAFAIFLTIGSCGGSTSPVKTAHRTELPTVDQSTPDRALKSYWAVQDSLRQDGSEARNPYVEHLARLVTGGAEADLKAVPIKLVLERDILELRQESDSRASAMVRIRNVTPIPTDAVSTDYTNKAREKGDEYKYVLEKVNLEWRVSEIWAFWEWQTPPEWHRRTGNKPSVPAYTVP
jgi:hypothetical protein